MMNTTTYTIPNISCNHCVHTITTELTDLAGVKEVVADLASKKVTVTFEPPASLEKIEALLAEIDYPPAS
jgi:copper chaperone CopZ